MKPVRLVEPAEQEMISAAEFYEQRSPGIGRDFLDKIESALDDIHEHPDRCPPLGMGVRRRLVHRFPYGILYRIEAQEIVVLAIAHLHRNPTYWIDRM